MLFSSPWRVSQVSMLPAGEQAACRYLVTTVRWNVKGVNRISYWLHAGRNFERICIITQPRSGCEVVRKVICNAPSCVEGGRSVDRQIYCGCKMQVSPLVLGTWHVARGTADPVIYATHFHVSICCEFKGITCILFYTIEWMNDNELERMWKETVKVNK
jgi:hypothetical protein